VETAGSIKAYRTELWLIVRLAYCSHKIEDRNVGRIEQDNEYDKGRD
jgi:hypothetical protein